LCAYRVQCPDIAGDTEVVGKSLECLPEILALGRYRDMPVGQQPLLQVRQESTQLFALGRAMHGEAAIVAAFASQVRGAEKCKGFGLSFFAFGPVFTGIAAKLDIGLRAGLIKQRGWGLVGNR